MKNKNKNIEVHFMICNITFYFFFCLMFELCSYHTVNISFLFICKIAYIIFTTNILNILQTGVRETLYQDDRHISKEMHLLTGIEPSDQQNTTPPNGCLSATEPHLKEVIALIFYSLFVVLL